MEEEKIIKETLRKNTKRDIIDYCLIGFVFIMIFVPALFKVIFYDSSIKVTTKQVVYLTFTCRKTVIAGDNQISTIIENKYKDSVIQKSVLDIRYSGGTEDDVPEIKEILSLNLGSKIGKEQKENGYVFTFDFVKNKELLEIEALNQYSMPASNAIPSYPAAGFYCERSSEIVEEEV